MQMNSLFDHYFCICAFVHLCVYVSMCICVHVFMPTQNQRAALE